MAVQPDIEILQIGKLCHKYQKLVFSVYGFYSKFQCIGSKGASMLYHVISKCPDQPAHLCKSDLCNLCKMTKGSDQI